MLDEHGRADLSLHEQLTLSEIVSRVLDRGAVISGDVMIRVAGVDLVYLGLQVVLTSVETARGWTSLPPRPTREP